MCAGIGIVEAAVCKNTDGGFLKQRILFKTA